MSVVARTSRLEANRCASQNLIGRDSSSLGVAGFSPRRRLRLAVARRAIDKLRVLGQLRAVVRRVADDFGAAARLVRALLPDRARLAAIARSVVGGFRPRADLALENLALRQQVPC